MDDEEIKELSKLLADKIKYDPKSESRLTIGWAVIIGILVAAMSFLLQGYITNARGITKLETEVSATQESIKEINKTQMAMHAILTDLRIDLQQCKQRGTGNAN